MKIKTNAEAMSAVTYCLLLGSFLYLAVALLGLVLFGPNITADLFVNIALKEANWNTYLMRVAFIVVLATHIPYVFFCCKECFLLIFDEAVYETTS